MSGALLTFIISGAAIIVFLVIKVIQEKYEVLLFWPDTRNKSEIVLQKQLKNVEYVLSQFNRKNAYIVLHFIINKIRSLFGKIQGRLDRKSHHLVGLIKAKPKLDTQRKASHFLPDIRRHKDKFKK